MNPPSIQRIDSPAGPAVGVNADFTGYHRDEADHLAGLLAGAGVTLVRQPARWADVEPEEGRLLWQPLDAAIRVLQEHGIRVLLTLETSPEWARRDPPPPAGWWLCDEPAVRGPGSAEQAPPTDPGDLARFATRLAARYSDLWGIEVWSEPNLLPNWRSTGPDPEDYGRLLKTVLDARDRNFPGLPVASAGLAPTTDVGVCYLSDRVFLDRLAATGVLERVDAIGVEPWGLRQGVSDPPGADELNFRRAELLHGILTDWGLGKKPVWAVAWGWYARQDGSGAQPADDRGSVEGEAAPTDAVAPGGAGEPVPPGDAGAGPWGGHPPEVAAEWVRLGYALAAARWPWMGAMFLWQLRPVGVDDSGWGFALVRPDGATTLAFDAVADVAAGRLPAPPSVSPAAAPFRAVDLVILLMAAAALGLAAALRRYSVIRRWAVRVRTPVLGHSTGACAAGFVALTLLPVVSPLWLPAPLAGVLGLIAVAGLLVLAAACPGLALLTAAAAAPFHAAVAMNVAGRSIDPLQLLILVAAAGSAAEWVSTAPGAISRRWYRLDALPAVLVIWGAASPLWAAMPEAATREWRVTLLLPALVYYALRVAPDRPGRAWRAISGLVLGGTLAAGWALVGVGTAALGRGGAVAAEGVLRARGPYGSPNNLALFLGRLLPGLVAVGFWARGPRRRAYTVALVVVGLAAFLTFSRGFLFLGAPAILAGVALLGRIQGMGPRVPRRGLAVAVVALLLFVVAFARTERVSGVVNPRPGGTVFIRLQLWESAVRMARDHPVLGVGLDNFLYAYRDRYVQRAAAQERFLSHPHNEFLDWWTRLGLPGLALFVWFALGNLWLGSRALLSGAVLPRARPGDFDPERFSLAVFGLGIVVYGLVHGLVDNQFFLPDLALTAWVAQAAILAADEWPESSRRTLSSRRTAESHPTPG